jgi:hypothetical protein
VIQGRRIGIWGTCDTAGMLAALRALLRRDKVFSVGSMPDDAGERDKWVQWIAESFDFLLVPISREIPAPLDELQGNGLSIIRYPSIFFKAFHPDLTYVGRNTTGGLVEPHYNSALCVWSFVNDVPASRAAKLFSGDVFAELGYFDAWNSSVDALRLEFEKCDMDFRGFFLKVKRTGAFMHSFNHPKAATLVAVARCVAHGLGEPASVLETPVTIFDALAQWDWPIYPEIGEYYGLVTDYQWTIEGEVLGLESYIEYMYNIYGTLNLKKDNLFFGLYGKLNEVVPGYLGVLS